VQAKFFNDPSVKMRDIDVQTANGIVTLRGQVGSDNERAQALLLARTTQGVQRVEDSLTVDASLTQPAPLSGSTAVAPGTSATAPPAPAAGTASSSSSAPAAVGTTGAAAADGTIESTLESKIAGDVQLKGAALEVSARDGVVLLQGRVANQAAKQRALSLARQTEGVTQVVDRVTVGTRP
jgi:osmotically-inducible protein OsmY